MPPSDSPDDSDKWFDGYQNLAAVAKNIQNANWYYKGKGQYDLGETVHRLLTLEYITSYRQFATTRYQPEKDNNPRDALSLEGIHK